MPLALLGASFASLLTSAVWFTIPLYGALVGLCTSLLPKIPTTGSAKRWAVEVRPGRALFYTQLFIYFGAGSLMLLFRGTECSFLQGQLYLSSFTVKFLYLILIGLAVGLMAALPLMRSDGLQSGAMGLSYWSLAPLLIAL